MNSSLDPIPVVETERLRLRGWRASDIDAYAAWLGDEDTVRFIGGKTMDRADAWRSMATMAGHWLLRGYGFWCVEEKNSGAVVGRVGLWFPEGWPAIEVGWLIGREHRRRGYALEAARASVRWGFDVLKLHSIISVIHVDNDASKRTAAALGETYERDMEVRGFPCTIWQITAHPSADGTAPRP